MIEVPGNGPEPDDDSQRIARQTAYYHGRTLRCLIVNASRNNVVERSVLKNAVLQAFQPTRSLNHVFLATLLHTMGSAGAVQFTVQCPRYPSDAQTHDLRRVMTDIRRVFGRYVRLSREADTEVKDGG